MKKFRRLYRVLPVLLFLFGAVPSRGQEVEPTDVSALLAAAGTQERAYEFRKAERIYREVLEIDAGNFDATMGLGRAASAVGEYPRAEDCYTRAAELDPERPDPARGMGSLAVQLDRREEARRWFDQALEINPDDPGSLAGLARIEIEDGNFEQADQLLTRAEELAPDSTSVLSSRSEYLFRTKDMDGSARLLRRILELRPLHLGANQRLSNGFLEADRLPPPAPGTPARYALEVQEAAALYQNTRLAAAKLLLTPLSGAGAPDGRPDFYLGLIDLRQGDPRQAIAHLRIAVRIEPENYLFRNALAVALKSLLASQRAEYGGGDDTTNRLGELAQRLPSPRVKDIGRIVRGYDQLIEQERKVINRAAEPLAHYLEPLLHQRVTHDILGFEEGMADARERRYLARRRTHDHRWYGGLRGVGGKNAATGIESIQAASQLRYDTFAHEFAHQVHYYGFSAEQKKVVRELYDRAMLTDRCLDNYAATNDREYLAQGYEAFISVAKSPYHHHLRRHTRAELRDRDPGLYRFLMRVTNTPDPDPALAPLVTSILAFYEWAGDPIELDRTRSLLLPFLDPSAQPR